MRLCLGKVLNAGCRFGVAFMGLLLPLLASAHLITVAATTPFPSNIAVNASANAVYTVTNISTIPLTGIEDQSASYLPSGIRIDGGTCGSAIPLNSGASCTLTLALQAGNTATTLSGGVYERALPSLDGVYSPIGPIKVMAPLIVTPSAGANGSINPSTPQSVTYDASIVLSATPNSGYGINEWRDNGELVQTGGSTYTLTHVAANHTVAVTFSAMTTPYTLTASSSDVTRGSVTPTTVPVSSGANATFTALANSGYGVSAWFVDSIPAPIQIGGTTFTFSNVISNHSLRVTFAPQWTVTASSADASKGSVSPTSAQVVQGRSATFTAAPNSGFGVAAWFVDGSAIPAQTGGTTFILNNVTRNRSVTVAFATTYTVTASSTDASKGQVSPANTQVTSGQSVALTAVANSGYAVGQWVDNGQVVAAGNTYVVSNVTAAHTVSVSFVDAYTVTASSTDASKGSVSPMTSQVTSGRPVLFTATPQSTYGVDEWRLDGALVQTGGTTYTLNNVLAPHTVTVSFGPLIQYTVTSSAGAGGSVSQNPSTTTVSRGDSVTFTAVPDVGYGVSQWLDNGQEVLTNETTYVLSSVNANHAVSVNFAYVYQIAVGRTSVASPYQPTLVQSVNAGGTWTIPSIANLPAAGYFNASACTGIGPTSICTAVGEATAANQPLLALSRTGGENSAWSVPTLSALTGLTGTFTTTSCTGTTTNATCVAAGSLTSGDALLLLTTDGGSTWSRPLSPRGQGSYAGSSCTGDGGGAICAIVGKSTATTPQKAYVAVYNGNNWTTPLIDNLPDGGEFATVSCTGSFSQAICVAAGGGTVVLSKDGGLSWTKASIGGIAEGSVTLTSSSCTGENVGAICTIAGKDIALDRPLVVVFNNTNNVTTWSVKTNLFGISGQFNTTSCTGFGNAARCIVAGNSASGTPWLAQSSTGGSTWTPTTFASMPSNGVFNGSNCLGSGTSAICTAVGRDDTTTSVAPLLVQSSNGGSSWSKTPAASLAAGLLTASSGSDS